MKTKGGTEGRIERRRKSRRKIGSGEVANKIKNL